MGFMPCYIDTASQLVHHPALGHLHWLNDMRIKGQCHHTFCRRMRAGLEASVPVAVCSPKPSSTLTATSVSSSCKTRRHCGCETAKLQRNNRAQCAGRCSTPQPQAVLVPCNSRQCTVLCPPSTNEQPTFARYTLLNEPCHRKLQADGYTQSECMACNVHAVCMSPLAAADAGEAEHKAGTATAAQQQASGVAKGSAPPRWASESSGHHNQCSMIAPVAA